MLAGLRPADALRCLVAILGSRERIATRGGPRSSRATRSSPSSARSKRPALDKRVAVARQEGREANGHGEAARGGAQEREEGAVGRAGEEVDLEPVEGDTLGARPRGR